MSNINKKSVIIPRPTKEAVKEYLEKCKEAGMDDHLVKPLDFDIVMEKLRLFLK